MERGWAEELLRVGPGRTPAPSARRSHELCGGAAGVGARGGVHVLCEGVAERGRCPARPPRSSPEEASKEKGKREEGAQAGRVASPSDPFSAHSAAPAGSGAKGWSASSPTRPHYQVGSVDTFVG